MANVFHTPCASFGGWELQQMREITDRWAFVAMSGVFYTLYASFRGCRLQLMREIANGSGDTCTIHLVLREMVPPSTKFWKNLAGAGGNGSKCGKHEGN